LSIIETLVVFAGIPLAVVAVVAGLVYAGSGRSNDRRYRPGRPFEFAPVWFLSAPDAPDSHDSHASNGQVALTGAGRKALTKAADSSGEQVQDVTGGASDRW